MAPRALARLRGVAATRSGAPQQPARERGARCSGRSLAPLVVAAWARAVRCGARAPTRATSTHGGWVDAGALAALCRAIPQGDVVVPASLHAAAWVLMIAAMMLPTTFPLLAMFRRITGGRPDAGRLAALVVARLLRRLVRVRPRRARAPTSALRCGGRSERWFVAHGWVVGAAVLAGAGLFQLSALKYRCLEQCRTPFGFVGVALARPRRRRARRSGSASTTALFCVGCCWALML